MKKNKLFVFNTLLLLFFLLFLFFVYRPYNYKKEYNINNYNVIEIFRKKDKVYKFYIKYNNQDYPFIINSKYVRKKELINEIKIYKNEKEICLLPVSDYIEFYPLCSNKKEKYTYNLSKVDNVDYKYRKITTIDKNYKDIKINKLNDLSFLIYNYKGFYLINNDTNKYIEIFKNDHYNLDLIYQYKNYLVLADYDQEYYFNKLYYVNILNGKVKEINFDYDISFDSKFLGEYKNNIFLLDKKNKREYKINLKRKNIELTDFQIVKNDKLIKKDYKQIIKNLKQEPNNFNEYKIIKDKLYRIINKEKIKITNKKVDKIIKFNNDEIFYLSSDKLYMFNNKIGEILLLVNFEWNFNNTNVIYFYK